MPRWRFARWSVVADLAPPASHRLKSPFLASTALPSSIMISTQISLSTTLEEHTFTLSYLRQVIQKLNVLPNLPKLPAQPLFETRYPDYEIRRAELTSTASRLSSEIALLSTAVYEIQEIIRNVQYSLDATKSACAPVHMLLPELLGEIFTLAVYDHDAPTDLKQAFTLSHVCSSWRTVALDWVRCGHGPIFRRCSIHRGASIASGGVRVFAINPCMLHSASRPSSTSMNISRRFTWL